MLAGLSRIQKIAAAVVAGVAIAGWATAIVFMVRSGGRGEELATMEAELAAQAGRISEIADALTREPRLRRRSLRHRPLRGDR